MITILSATAAIAVSATPIQAQSAALAEGEWTGKLIPPEGGVIAVKFQVSNDTPAPQLVILIADERFETRDLDIGEDVMRFSWSPGPEVPCELKRINDADDPVYEGTCGDYAVGIGRITMVAAGRAATPSCPALGETERAAEGILTARRGG